MRYLKYLYKNKNNRLLRYLNKNENKNKSLFQYLNL